MSIRSISLCLLAVAALSLTAGCIVEERIWWSPDGTRAAVRVGDRFCLVDTNGNLSTSLASDVESAAWLPDGHGLVLVRHLTATNWQEAARLLPPDEIADAQSLAKSLPGLISAALAFADGDTSDLCQKFFERMTLKNPDTLSPAILYLRDTQPGVLRQALQGSRDPDKLAGQLSNASTTQVAEVSVLLLDGNQPAGPPRVIERSAAALQQPRPSPSSPVLAFLRKDSLVIAPLDGSTNRIRVAERVEGDYDWTPDGKSLVYAVRLNENWESGAVNLARIERRVVIDASGGLVAGEATPLATSGFAFRPRVRSLADGRVLFAGLRMQLPATSDAAQESRFYWIDPSLGTNGAPVTIPGATGSLPQELAYFAPSPDGRQIAVVESGSDAVAVLDVTNGALKVISPKYGWKSRTLPAWRATNELYFAGLPGSSSTRPEVLCWSKNGTLHVFSHDWSDEAVNDLLEKPGK